MFEDTRQVLTAPARWTGREWLIAGGTAVAIGGVMFFDKDVSDFIARNHNHTTDEVAKNIDPFGQEYSFGALGAFYVGGVLFHDPKARAVAQDGLAASLIASGIISPALKYSLGRARRDENVGSLHFDPFKSSYNSFPSGHTTQAFAVASVIALHYESYWIKGTAYGIATLVGAARIQRATHFFYRGLQDGFELECARYRRANSIGSHLELGLTLHEHRDLFGKSESELER